jgi:hypothetical protein
MVILMKSGDNKLRSAKPSKTPLCDSLPAGGQWLGKHAELSRLPAPLMGDTLRSVFKTSQVKELL